MPRIARIVMPHIPHLVLQRGNRGEKIFPGTADRAIYLGVLGRYLRQHEVKLLAYRLESAEVWLVVVPPDEDSLARCLRSAHGLYSQLINRRLGATGHLFHGRFHSCPVDDQHLALSLRYVERPTGQGSSAYRCSSALRNSGQYVSDRPAAEAAEGEGTDLHSLLYRDLPLIKQVPNWQAWLEEPVDPAAVTYLLSRLSVGKPAGDGGFVRRIEEVVGKNLSRKPGRPRRTPIPTALAAPSSLEQAIGSQDGLPAPAINMPLPHRATMSSGSEGTEALS